MGAEIVVGCSIATFTAVIGMFAWLIRRLFQHETTLAVLVAKVEDLDDSIANSSKEIASVKNMVLTYVRRNGMIENAASNGRTGTQPAPTARRRNAP